MSDRRFATPGDTPQENAASPGLPDTARSWAWLAVGSLVIAGLLSLVVVIGRLPWVSPLIADPLFFKRGLVVHVDLALLVWFYAFLAVLGSLRAGVPGTPLTRWTLGLAMAGVVTMVAGAFAPGAQPVLANYIPVINHPVFLGGLACFFLGVVVFFLQNLTLPTKLGLLPTDAAHAVVAAGVGVLLAAATYISARTGMPSGMDAQTFFEFSTWGAGHVLQVANTCGMLAVWLWMLHRATGAQVLPSRTSGLLFVLLLAPHFAAPLLTARGSLDRLYINGSTELMRWGIFPVVLVILAACVLHLRKHPVTLGNAAGRALKAGFAASATLVVIGFLLGSLIRESNTLIPAHYHAALGAVTAAFMAGIFLLVEAASPAEESRFTRLWLAARHQLPLYGIGQIVFAAGFALGGLFGLGRKSYGAEQYVRGAGEITGIVIMSLGGLIAVVAGLWFLFLALREMRAWLRPNLGLTSPPTSNKPR